MKNLKKVLAVVIALTMVISTVAFAATFSDVEDSAAYTEAVNLGVALNLFNGYEDGTFKPTGDITRAEFSAIVVRMLGQEAQADGAKGATKYTDVASTHWAAGYINIASTLTIVNGYGDGVFGPEDNVTYEQAVKMIVVALGYGPAVGAAGYPVGYLTIAQQNGITTGVKGTNGVAANRGQVALLVFNALDVPMMEQTGFGTYVDYIVQDGTGDTYRKTIMTEKLGVVKLKVFAKESYELKSAKKLDLVKVRVENAYSSKYANKNYDDEKVFAKGEEPDINVGKTNLKNFVGSQVTLYISYDENSDNEPVAIFVKKYVSSSEEVTVYSDNVDKITVSGAGVATVEYYESDNAARIEKLTVDNDADVYVNGYKSDKTVKAEIEACYGTITFSLEKTGTQEDFDTVFITSYQNMVVDEVNTSTGRVLAKYGEVTSIIFKESNTDNSSTLVDKDGNTLEWSTLEENDVLSVQRESNNGRTVNICTLVGDVVTGIVSEISEDGVNGVDTEYTIGGTSYKMDNQITGFGDLKLEDEGSFYLDVLGRISYFNVESSVSNNYAYVLDAKEIGGFDNDIQIKMFTYAGEVVTLDTATKVKVSYTNAAGTSYVANQPFDSKDLIVGVAGAFSLVRNQFITFGVNSSGKINKIAFRDGTKDEKYGKDVKTFARYAGPALTSFDYDKARFSIGSSSVYISNSTIIMQAPRTTGTDATPVYDDDDYEIIAISALTDDFEKWANVSAYDVNDDKVASVILIESDVDFTSGSNGMAMVISKASAKNNNGTTIDKISVLQNGNNNDFKAIDLLGAEDTALDVALGDVLVTTFNGKGEISKYAKVASVVGENSVVPSNFTYTDDDDHVVNTTYINYVNNVLKGDVKFTFGEVTGRRSSRLTLGTGVNEEEVTIPVGANVYVYNQQGSRAVNKVTAPEDRFNVFTVANDGSIFDSDGEELESVYALVREYDDDVVDVILYLF